jgi:nucleotide-binding universal stress UspA family protein
MSFSFNNIILAYDGSEGSDKALKLAALVTNQGGNSALTVVNVYDEKIENRRMDIAGTAPAPMSGYLAEGIPAATSFHDFNQPEYSTQSIITNSVDQVFFNAKKKLDGVNVSFQVLEGAPAESICAFAEETGADLIITGRSGKSGLKGLLLGNVTEKITKMAPCHVLIAK